MIIVPQVMLLAFALAVPAARPKAKARAAEPDVARVIERTRERAYFNRGSDAGFDEGAIVEVVKSGREAGTCVIEKSSEHHSQCSDAGKFALDDRVRIVKGVPRKEEEGKALAADSPRPGQKKIESPMPVVAATPFDKVAFAKTSVSSAVPLRPQGIEASASTGYQVWSSANQRNSSYQVSNADVLVRHVPLFAGFGASIDASALGWTYRPNQERFRPNTPAQLYIFEASIESREVGRNYVASVGRIRPWHAPGLVALDGGQAGWRSSDGLFEVGALAGGLPDLSSLSPSTDRWTAGAYWSASIPLSEPIIFRQDGRLAYVSISGAGGHAEAEATAHALVGHVADLGVGARLGFGGQVSGAVVDNFRADLSLSPFSGFRVLGGYRERRASLPDLDSAATAAGFAIIAARHADLTLSYDVASWMAVAVVGGYAGELDGDTRSRGFAGPEVTFSGVLGRLGSVAVGYQEERGWLAGRTGYFQATFFPLEALSVIARLSYFEDTNMDTTARELGLFTRASYALGNHLLLSAMVMSRAGLSDVDQSFGGGPLGITARLSLSGSL